MNKKQIQQQIIERFPQSKLVGEDSFVNFQIAVPVIQKKFEDDPVKEMGRIINMAQSSFNGRFTRDLAFLLKLWKQEEE